MKSGKTVRYRLLALALIWLLLAQCVLQTWAISASSSLNSKPVGVYLNPNTGRFCTMDTFVGKNQDPLSLHKYIYGADNPANHIDPSGHEFELPSTTFAISIAVGLAAFDLAAIAQVSANFHKYYSLSVQDRAAALAVNNISMASLQRIIDSHGDRTFQDENLGLGGMLGVKLPGNSAFQRAANQFESYFNVEGYPTGIYEALERIANSGTSSIIPLPDSQTADQREELAKALLHRLRAFDGWLRRNI